MKNIFCRCHCHYDDGSFSKTTDFIACQDCDCDGSSNIKFGDD